MTGLTGLTGLTGPRAAGAVLAVAACLGMGLTGCAGGGNTPESPVSQAASLASQGARALASATAEAGRRLDEVKNGVDARDAIVLGTPATAAGGRVAVGITAVNKATATRSFAVQVDFRDADGNLLDVVVVTVPDVRAGATAKATARSTRTLSGQVRTEVARALRY